MLTSLDFLREMNMTTLVFKLLLATILPSILGVERERRQHNSSISTYALVTLGATLTMILSQYESLLFQGPWKELATEIGITSDVSRFGAQVINGIGFLGAGAIIVTGGKDVKGLTTAAGLWSSACMGLAIGVGFYECVIVAFFLMLFAMHSLNPLQDYIVKQSKHMQLYTEFSDVRAVTEIVTTLRNEGVHVLDMEIQKNDTVSGDEENNTSALMMLLLPKGDRRFNIISHIANIDAVITVEEL